MRIVKLPAGNEISIRVSPKELPINRFTDFEKYLVQSAGIGSTMGDVDKHFANVSRFMQAAKYEEAVLEWQNMHLNLYMMLNRINIKHIAFACLIDSVDGKKIDDYSEEALKNLCEELGKMGLTEEMLSDILESVKKNSILN